MGAEYAVEEPEVEEQETQDANAEPEESGSPAPQERESRTDESRAVLNRAAAEARVARKEAAELKKELAELKAQQGESQKHLRAAAGVKEEADNSIEAQIGPMPDRDLEPEQYEAWRDRRSEMIAERRFRQLRDEEKQETDTRTARQRAEDAFGVSKGVVDTFAETYGEDAWTAIREDVNETANALAAKGRSLTPKIVEALALENEKAAPIVSAKLKTVAANETEERILNNLPGGKGDTPAASTPTVPDDPNKLSDADLNALGKRLVDSNDTAGYQRLTGKFTAETWRRFNPV